MEKKLIELQLQSLRDKLYEVVEEKGSFTHPAVLAISEEADQLIVALQTMKRQSVCEHNKTKERSLKY
ncbi:MULTISPECIES: aspartyl-phosphate phosphatase Spo0E family protein [Paenibacillus]|uniref:aspartyl-phosphate phosphatase Spo0E family protein n=1 Tax=Paenibacillus TaxID=44249 RepID=UPI00203E3BB6|nr:aspartyl-phosphate phosphatase Spo0E family protein [Paenibacillus camelliae]MCM3635294.1 aspartyl-phosphate phosphatase Spo0E family protein [Paenibacillus camelliae]